MSEDLAIPATVPPARVVSAAGLAEEQRVLSLRPKLAPVHGRYGDHPHQSYDLWPAVGPEDPNAPMVMLLHGGYWRYDRMHLTPFAEYLSEQGMTTVLPGFRRVGGAGGFPETFDDVIRAVSTIPDGRPIVLAGHCSGGHLALWLAARSLLPAGSRWQGTTPGLTAVLALAPITDLTGTIADGLSDGAGLQLLGGREQAAERLPLVDPLTLLRSHSSTGVRTVLLHGENDEEVPLRQYSDYLAVHSDAELIRLPHTGHYTLIEPGAPAAEAVVQTLRRLRREAPVGRT